MMRNHTIGVPAREIRPVEPAAARTGGEPAEPLCAFARSSRGECDVARRTGGDVRADCRQRDRGGWRRVNLSGNEVERCGFGRRRSLRN